MVVRKRTARAITIFAALSIPVPTLGTILLTEGGQASERNEKEEDKSLLPLFPKKNSRRIKRSSKKDKELLSLLWGDGEPFPIPIPSKAIKPNANPWTAFWGGLLKINDKRQDNFREDREKIRKTLSKFYRLADPKFARASLATARNGYATNTKNEQILGVTKELENGFDKDGDDLVPGTVLEVFTKIDEYDEIDNMDNMDEGNQHEEMEEKPVRLEEYAYELVDRIQRELGATPQHYMDFAYRSVTASSSGFSNSGSSNRMADDLLIEGGENFDEDQPICKTLISTSTDNEGGEEEDYCKDDSDRAMAFFASWWKWWLPFANSQWWKDNGSSKADYEIGKTPFAGGSIGEVWRGRRICHRNRDNHREGSYRAFVPRASGDEDDIDDEDDWEEEEIEDCDEETPLVLKRLKIERGYLLLEAGLREVYFGKLIARVLEDTKQNMYTVYVDHFFREVPKRNQPSRAFGGLPNASSQRANDLELWIVYKDAGPSLRSYIYSPIASDGFILYQHSKLWTKLRTFSGEDDREKEWEDESSVETLFPFDRRSSPPRKKDDQTPNEKKNKGRKMGRLFLQKTLRDILEAAAELHKRGIVHRDIKPSNVMCQFDQVVSVEELFESEKYMPGISCKLGDFSSGWDRYTSEHLYTKGPSPGEQTEEYAPPESYVGPYWVPFDEDKPQSYDSWSIGVLALELLLGTPNVFTVDQRTDALLRHKLKRAMATEEEIEYAMYLAALSNFCIFVPSNETSKGDYIWPLRYGDPLYRTAMVKESCTLQDFHRALRARDPLGIGFDSSTDLLLHLIWKLLAFDPSERITAEEALQHPFFISPDGTIEALYDIPGYHDALISEVLDARIDFDVEDDIKTFQCPKCGRIFHDWRSCHQHANLRKHAKFCVYNHTVLPSCINTHAMLPDHPTSGYCDLQGRRKTIEDFHSIHLHHDHQFYGIFDGHTGNLASKFAASELYTELLSHLPELMQIEDNKALGSRNTATNGRAWKEEIRVNVTKAFETVHERFLERITTMTSAIAEVGSAPKMDQSGTTATALLVTEDVVIAAVLGDSRGVLASATGISSKSSSSQWKEFPEVSAIPFSIDHVASNPKEEALVLKRGGFVSNSGGTARVNGTLAITRSIGDANLAPVLSREPHVWTFERSDLRELCGELGSGNQTAIPCFAILASDGLWDVMSNQEAIDMVLGIILRHNEDRASQSGGSTREVALFPSYDEDYEDEESGGPFQESAERLAVEAYVRGSTDNIGVCVVAID